MQLYSELPNRLTRDTRSLDFLAGTPSGIGDIMTDISLMACSIVFWGSGVVALPLLASFRWAVFSASILPAGGGVPAVAPCTGSENGIAEVASVFLELLLDPFSDFLS